MPTDFATSIRNRPEEMPFLHQKPVHGNVWLTRKALANNARTRLPIKMDIAMSIGNSLPGMKGKNQQQIIAANAMLLQKLDRDAKEPHNLVPGTVGNIRGEIVKNLCK